MKKLERFNPISYVMDRVDSTKEIMGPKVTLFLIEDKEEGLIWVEEVPEDSIVLAKGLAAVSVEDNKIGFLSIEISKNTEKRIMFRLFRDYGATITSITRQTEVEYHQLSEILLTFKMIPIALMIGRKWKNLG